MSDTSAGPYKQFHYEGNVTDEHKALYHQFGFIHFKGVITAASCAVLEHKVDAVRDHIVRNGISSVYGIPVKKGRDEQGNTIVQRLPFTSVHDRHIEQVLVESGIGAFRAFIDRPDCRLGFNEKDGIVTNHYMNTGGSIYRQMGWHVDGLRDWLLLRPLMPMINIGIYLTDSNEHNGGLRVLPGSHQQGIAGMLLRKMHMAKSADSKELIVRAQRGDVVLHDGNLWHRVASSPLIGAASYRKVIYVPLICGKPAVRTAQSKTPFYQSVNRLVSYR